MDSEFPNGVSVDSEFPNGVSVDSGFPNGVAVESEFPNGVSVDSEFPNGASVDSIFSERCVSGKTEAENSRTEGGVLADSMTVDKNEHQSHPELTQSYSELPI